MKRNIRKTAALLALLCAMTGCSILPIRKIEPKPLPDPVETVETEAPEIVAPETEEPEAEPAEVEPEPVPARYSMAR